jgi:hypothetical protein
MLGAVFILIILPLLIIAMSALLFYVSGKKKKGN